MPKAKYHEIHFTVRGSGAFPYDMLRYDRCFPASERESAGLACPYHGPESSKRDVQITAVNYDGNNATAPTERRWNSFGWKVLDYDYGMRN